MKEGSTSAFEKKIAEVQSGKADPGLAVRTLLVEKGTGGWNTLHYAVYNGSLDILESILKW